MMTDMQTIRTIIRQEERGKVLAAALSNECREVLLAELSESARHTYPLLHAWGVIRKWEMAKSI